MKWESTDDTICTIVIGSGPDESVREYHSVGEEFGLKHTFFLGAKPQPVLAECFSAANVGVFPSYSEPFGLSSGVWSKISFLISFSSPGMVFIECMACGTPTIGANSGGPKDFVR